MSLVDRASVAVEELIAGRRLARAMAMQGLNPEVGKVVAAIADRPLADVMQENTNTGWEWARVVESAEPFWWDPPIVDLVRSAAAGLPDWTLRPEMLPVPSAFFWLSRPLVLPRGSLYGDGPAGPLCAIGYKAEMDAGRGGIDGARVIFFVQAPGPLHGVSHVALYIHRLPFGRTVQGIEASIEPSAPRGNLDEQANRLIWSFFGACLLFLEQRIVASSIERLDRAARHRLEKADVEYPLLRVIRLRTPEKRAGTDDHAAVDWQYRWLVRGHWRQQFHPSDQSHRPVWITPYVKGPDDKPLKVPDQSVFAVVQ